MLRGVLSVPQNNVMDQNNVMSAYSCLEGRPHTPKIRGFHKKASRTGEVKLDVLKFGVTLHVQMSRWFC